MIVVWPTSTPATSVMALSGPVGRMPTFSPKSEARGRLLEFALCAETDKASNKEAATATKPRAMKNCTLKFDQLNSKTYTGSIRCPDLAARLLPGNRRPISLGACWLVINRHLDFAVD